MSKIQYSTRINSIRKELKLGSELNKSFVNIVKTDSTLRKSRKHAKV